MSSPDLGPKEVAAVCDVLRSSTLSQGPYLAAFEQRLAAYLGIGEVVGVSSGTAGLHLALRAAGVGRGDRVLTTPFSFVATANAILYLGATPVFVDVEPETGNLDPSRLAEALEARVARKARPPRAILPVHVFGRPAAMDRIMAIAEPLGIPVIEDACEALGSSYKGRRAGALGDAAVFGFYPNKQITTGEGGAVATWRTDWADKIRSWRNQGRGADAGGAEAHVDLGYNYRLDEISAALGAVQMERLEELLRKRDQVAAWYDERLKIDGVTTPRPSPGATRMSWFVYVVRFEEPSRRDDVRKSLRLAGIPSRVYFRPIHQQPFYRKRFGRRQGRFPVAERLGAVSLALPFSSVMTEAEVDQVADALRAAVQR